MPIEIHTELMPQYLPGANARGVQRVHMVPASNGQVLLFTLDDHQHLTVWLSSPDGYTRWRQIRPSLLGMAAPRVRDMDIVSNHGQGRRDGTVDLMLMVDTTEGTTAWLVWHGLLSSNDPAYWEYTLASAERADDHGCDVTHARWGAANSPRRSTLMCGRSRDDGRPHLWWTATDDHGSWRPAKQPLPQGFESLVSMACTHMRSPSGEPALQRESYLLSFHSNAGGFRVQFTQPALGLDPLHTRALVSPHGFVDDWGPVSNWSTPLTVDALGGNGLAYFTMQRLSGDPDIQGMVVGLNVWDARPVPTYDSLSAEHDARHVQAPQGLSVRTTSRVNAPAEVLRYTLFKATPTQRSRLRCTRGTHPDGREGQSTWIAADVSAYAVCECVDHDAGHNVLHVLLAYEEGGIELFSQDSVSGLWQRYTVADDRVQTGVHEVQSHTVRIRAFNDTWAPLHDSPLELRVEYPCYGLLNGRATHFSPLAPTVVKTQAHGEVTLVLPVDSLGAPRIDIEAVALGQTLQHNPMARLATRLRAVPDAAALQRAVASDGSHPFAHVPLARCDNALRGVTQWLHAYDSALQPRHQGHASTLVVRRTRLRWRGRELSVEHEWLAEPAPTEGDGPDDAMGDILSYLWTDLEQDVEITLEWLADGLCRILVPLGSTVWSAIVDVAAQAFELIDFTLQKTMGVELKDLVNWLGWVFDWDDILRTQKAMRHVQQLLCAAGQDWLTHTLPTEVAKRFGEVKAQLSHLPALDERTRALLQRKANAGDPQIATSGNGTASPQAGWVTQTFANYLPVAELANGTVDDGLADELGHIVSEVTAPLKTLALQLADWDAASDVDDMSLQQIVDDLFALIGTATLDVAQHLVEALLALFARMAALMLDALDQRIDLPVLTALYEQRLAPGHTLSLLDAITLAAALAGNVASKAGTGHSLIPPDLYDLIMAATRLDDLLAPATSAVTAEQQSIINAMLTLVASGSKTVYLVAWYADAWGTGSAGITKVKTLADTLSWLVSLGWASAICGIRSNNNSASYLLSVIGLVLQGFGSRPKDVIEFVGAWRGKPVPPSVAAAMATCESLFAGFFTLISNVTIAVSYTNLNPRHHTDLDYWRSLLAMPSLQGFSHAIYSLLAMASLLDPDPETELAIKVTRTVANSLRSLIPYVSTGLLIKCIAEDWETPGIVSD